MINAVANAGVPKLTLMMGGSYGAGNYGMCGRSFEPRFIFAWPNYKTAVMGPKQLAGVMEIVMRGRRRAPRHRGRRGAARGGHEGGRGADRDRVGRLRLLRRALGRRHDRPPRHPHRARHRALRLPQRTRSPAPAASASSGCEATGTCASRRRSARCWSPTAARSPGGSSPAAGGWGSRTVAVYSDPDARRAVRRSRPTRRCRSAARPRPSPTCASTRCIDAAARTGADAIHPGYGFLAENADFARGRRRRRPDLGRPAAGGDRGDGLEGRRPGDDGGGRGAGRARRRARAAGADARSPPRRSEIGYPLLVKASAGGGGKGMRAVGEAARSSRRRSRAPGARPRRLRRRDDLPRAAARAAAPRRDPGLRRRARQHRQPRRARVLDPAPPPEGRRGGALAGRRPRPAGADGRGRGQPPRRRSATSAPARSSSCSTPTATSTSSR